MITITTILINHSIECKKDLPIVGNRKLERIKTEIKFDSEKIVREYWRQLAYVLNIPKTEIDFYTIDDSGKGCIVK